MANPKYAPAPQRDSFDEENQYSQPPPSYQAEASTNAALLSGIPREEDDNVPDDFKVCTESFRRHGSTNING